MRTLRTINTSSNLHSKLSSNRNEVLKAHYMCRLLGKNLGSACLSVDMTKCVRELYPMSEYSLMLRMVYYISCKEIHEAFFNRRYLTSTLT